VLNQKEIQTMLGITKVKFYDLFPALSSNFKKSIHSARQIENAGTEVWKKGNIGIKYKYFYFLCLLNLQ
jgi:hypothetical protein